VNGAAADDRAPPALLLHAVDLDGRRADVRVIDGRIDEIAPRLSPRAREQVVDAGGGALLPGLHDHHLHLHALAARARSIACGPPDVTTPQALAHALRAAAPAADGWLRGIDYHESVAGELTCTHLDALVGGTPLRLQHRGGKLWMLNSAAIARLRLQDWAHLDGVECDAQGCVTGRLFRLDDWLQARLHELGGAPGFPDLGEVSALLARYGITGVTDASVHNDARHLAAFEAAVAGGRLRQRLRMLGSDDLPRSGHPRIHRGALKVLLDDDDLPDIDALAARIRRAHAAGRGAAFHCVTRIELLFALAALAQARSVPTAGIDGVACDRIEHGGIVPDDALALLFASGAHVVTQQNFIAERGDRYRLDVPADEQPLLYRLATLLRAGIPVGGGSDAPYGVPDPWAAMRAAVTRRCASGALLGEAERVSPERALALFTSTPSRPGGAPQRLRPGAVADLCLLDRPWSDARTALDASLVAATLVAGEFIHARGQDLRA
jgi:predicted amidohydrolase YtcJ